MKFHKYEYEYMHNIYKHITMTLRRESSINWYTMFDKRFPVSRSILYETENKTSWSNKRDTPKNSKNYVFMVICQNTQPPKRERCTSLEVKWALRSFLGEFGLISSYILNNHENSKLKKKKSLQKLSNFNMSHFHRKLIGFKQKNTLIAKFHV